MDARIAFMQVASLRRRPNIDSTSEDNDVSLKHTSLVSQCLYSFSLRLILTRFIYFPLLIYSLLLFSSLMSFQFEVLGHAPPDAAPEQTDSYYFITVTEIDSKAQSTTNTTSLNGGLMDILPSSMSHAI